MREMQTVAGEMHANGTMDDASFAKIMLCDVEEAPPLPPLSGEDIRALRERARMSLAVFARHLKSDGRLRVAVGARRQTPNRRRARSSRRDPAQGDGGDCLRRSLSEIEVF